MLALDLIQECLRTQNPYLDLGRCGLTDGLVAEGAPIDIALCQCTHLTTLILSNEWINWEKQELIQSQNKGKPNYFILPLPALNHLKGLETLICAGYIYNRWDISNMIFVKELTHLKYLDVSYNQISKLEGLDNLQSLQTFNIAGNQINKLQGLDNLQSLQTFDIYSNQINKLEGLDGLQSLQTFVIFSNQISKLEGLDNLQSLQTFDIYSNQISKLEGLDNLQSLQTFNIAGNQINKLQGLDNLQFLQTFHISSNQISKLEGLDNLQSLQTFDISYNQISKLEGLDSLQSLQTFDISYNKVEDIRPLKKWMQQKENSLQVVWKELYITQKGEINVYNNPLKKPSVEIIKQGNQAILDWFEANKKCFNEVKVLLIGDAKAGKTSLLRKLKDNIFEEKEEQTDGIIIEPFAFKHLPTFAQYPNLHDATAYFWDFGGQEIMSATHQFFMTRRSVYLLLLEARKDKKADEQLRELMEQVQTFGGNSQVIVVVNKIDLNKGFSLDSQVLLEEFPQIQNILYVSCKEGTNIEEVKQALATAIPKAELYETEIDVRWKAIKEELQQATQKEHYLAERSFEETCDRHQLLDKQGQNHAISFLHDLGILLHFEQLDLKEYYVLDPYWVTTGVYQILTSPRAAGLKGHIPVSDLDYIINEEEDKKDAYCPHKKIRYYTNETRFIADIMTQFKLAYYTNNKTLLLVPDLFENQTPLGKTKDFTEANDVLRLVYDYTYLPKSVLPRFMVEIQRDIETPWRTGVILNCKERNNTQALVMVREKQISITVKGDAMQKREYLSIIRFFLDRINHDLKLQPTLLIPLPGHERHYVKYDTLFKMERAGEKYYMNWDIEKEFEIGLLLNGIVSKEEIKQKSGTIINIYGSNNQVNTDIKNSNINSKHPLP